MWKCEKGKEQERICKLWDIDICDCCVHGIKSNDENAAKIVKDENIRNGVPILKNTRLTPSDVLNFMTEFVLENLDQFNEEIAKLNREQIFSCYDYIFERLR